MKRIAVAFIAILVVFTSVPFSAYAKTSDMEIIISPDGLPEKSYTPTYSSIGQITLMSEDEALPSSFDARDYGWVTPLKRQEWGTCWSYAKISILETYNISQGFDDINADYSEAHLAWFGNTKSTDVNNPTYGDGVTVNFNPDDYFIAEYPNAAKMGAYTIGATHSTAIGALARWSGIANEADFPPESEGPIIDETYRYNTDSGFVIKSAEWLNNITDVKNWVSNFGSASISFSYGNMHADFNGPDITWTYEYDYNRTSLHEVAIIGWDDYFPMREKYSYYETEWGRPDFMPPADGAWLCKDSNNDYLWISYYDASIIEIVGYTAQPSDTYRENYTYNGTGTQVYGTLQGPASVSNVFKTDEHEILSAVSTYTVEENQNLNIKIYTDINSNYTDPTQGTLALNYPIIVPKKGYHTIELPQDIKLNPNTYFSVVIEYEATNGVTRIPIEYDYDFGYENANFTYSSNKGESFIYVSSRSAWFYSEEQGAKNVFVQAFTNCDHQPETTTVSASCKEAGYSETKCTQCKEILKSTVVPKADCADGDWSYVGNNTFNKICPDCGAVSENKTVVLDVVEDTISLYNGETGYITFHTDADFTENVVFSSSNPSVVSVNNKGNITANSVGKAIVTLNIPDTDIIAECSITVLPRMFTVTWNIYESMIVETVKETESITEPSNPSRTGYVFAGWDNEIPDVMPAENLVFTAQWVPATDTTYAVETYTMNTDGDYDKTVKVLFGTTENKVTAEYKINEGFFLDESKSVLSGTIEAKGTLVLKVYLNRKSYSFTTVVDGISEQRVCLYGSAIIQPEAPAKPEYKFMGWSESIPDTMPAEDITVTAVYEKAYICPDCNNEILGEENISEHITSEARKKAIVSIKNNTGSKTIKYGETLCLTAVVEKMPENTEICWYVDGEKQGTGETFDIKFNNGTKVVEVKLVDENENVLTDANNEEISDSQTVTVKAGFFWRLISFFKNLFRISRFVEQALGITIQ